jgi:hypothetical protein
MSKVACHPAEKHRALEERLQALADTRSALESRMAELHELRRRVQQADLSEELKKPPLKKRIVRPGRLFMLSQWTIGRSTSAGALSSTRWTP